MIIACICSEGSANAHYSSWSREERWMQNACPLQSDNHCSILLIAWFLTWQQSSVVLDILSVLQQTWSNSVDKVNRQIFACLALTRIAFHSVHVICGVLTTESSTFHNAITLLLNFAKICADTTVSVQIKLGWHSVPRAYWTQESYWQCTVECRIHKLRLASQTHTNSRDSIGTTMHY